MEKTKISESELEVMKVLWERSPLSASEIINEIQKHKDWSSKTIRTLIDRLVAKEHLQVDRLKPQHVFFATTTRAEVEKQMRHTLANQLYNGSVGRLLMNFVGQEKLSNEEIQELKALLEQMEK